MTRMTPFPHQIEGAEFLARQTFAALGDEPRVGKTGTAIMAADMLGASTILVVTTASGRGVWAKGFADWSIMDRPVAVLAAGDTALPPTARVVIVGWPSVGKAEYRTRLLARKWDILILDESHYAKSFDATRTQAVYGVPMGDGVSLARQQCLASRASVVWCLSGTLMPNSPFDLYPMLRANTPGVLLANQQRGWPDVSSALAFRDRYCTTRPMKIGHGPYARRLDVITGGKNLPELRERIDGLILRRTQQDVGIRAPIYETMPLIVPEAKRRAVEREAGKMGDLLAAIDKGSTRDLEMHLGPLRRLTGALKADAVADAVIESVEKS